MIAICLVLLTSSANIGVHDGWPIEVDAYKIVSLIRLGEKPEDGTLVDLTKGYYRVKESIEQINRKSDECRATQIVLE